MATKGKPSNGQTPLEAAMALLIHNQAEFVGQLAESRRLHLEYERERLQIDRDSEDRVRRIETQMAEVIRILTEHNRRIDQLTEAVREKIGFKPQ